MGLPVAGLTYAEHCTTSAVFYKDDYKTVWGDRLSFKRNPDNIFVGLSMPLLSCTDLIGQQRYRDYLQGYAGRACESQSCGGPRAPYCTLSLPPTIPLLTVQDDGTIALGGYATGSPEYWWGWLYISVFTSSTKEAMKQRLSQMGVVWAAEEDGQV
jgi:hypothetical protein